MRNPSFLVDAIGVARYDRCDERLRQLEIILFYLHSLTAES